jgi:hypothetical protein
MKARLTVEFGMVLPASVDSVADGRILQIGSIEWINVRDWNQTTLCYGSTVKLIGGANAKELCLSKGRHCCSSFAS